MTKVCCQAATFEEDLTLMIVGLGQAQIVLGMPWLTKNNPWIDWEKKLISFDDEHIERPLSLWSLPSLSKRMK